MYQAQVSFHHQIRSPSWEPTYHPSSPVLEGASCLRSSLPHDMPFSNATEAIGRLYLWRALPVPLSTAISSAASSGSFAPMQQAWAMSRAAVCLAMTSPHSSVIWRSQ